MSSLREEIPGGLKYINAEYAKCSVSYRMNLVVLRHQKTNWFCTDYLLK